MSEDTRVSVRVVDFDPRWRADFARLNIEWLERWFSVEAVDRDVLANPESAILANGGRILFAVDDSDRAVGTVALLHHEDGRVELTKMAVAPETRGLGVGRKLAEAALAVYCEMDGRELFLESNDRLDAAVRLYESIGFQHVRPESDSHYERANVFMVWNPGAAASNHRP